MFLINESSAGSLFDSSVAAFPHTTRRQHVVQPIVISNLEIVPFVGMKTLFLKAQATNEDRQYNTIMLFKDVNYSKDIGKIQITASDGKKHWLRKPSLSYNDVMVRCNCEDFYWRFNYYDHLDHSLYGRKRQLYKAIDAKPPANPAQMPGICKHLMKMSQVLKDSGFLSN